MCSGNVLLSPISLKIALVLLYEGAQDETAHELAGAMQLPGTRTATRDRFSSILRSLQVNFLNIHSAEIKIGLPLFSLYLS